MLDSFCSFWKSELEIVRAHLLVQNFSFCRSVSKSYQSFYFWYDNNHVLISFTSWSQTQDFKSQTLGNSISYLVQQSKPKSAEVGYYTVMLSCHDAVCLQWDGYIYKTSNRKLNINLTEDIKAHLSNERDRDTGEHEHTCGQRELCVIPNFYIAFVFKHICWINPKKCPKTNLITSLKMTSTL